MNIFALSTGRGPSGIAILRLSGKDSLQISKLITRKNEIKSKDPIHSKFFKINIFLKDKFNELFN